MLVAMSFLDRFFKQSYEKDLKEAKGIVKSINDLEGGVSSLSDADLKNKTVEFKKRLASGETLDEILPEAFAVVRETAKRTLGERHYDVQLVGGYIMHKGNIAEMRTGEGKTLVGTLPAYLNALSGKGVHVVTIWPSAIVFGWDKFTQLLVLVLESLITTLHIYMMPTLESKALKMMRLVMS